MAINNVSVQCNGGFLLDIILLIQCYYHRGAHLNVMKRFCPYSQCSHLNILTDIPPTGPFTVNLPAQAQNKILPA